MADVVEINSLDALTPFRLSWDALFASTPRASFFHTYEWFTNYWNHFGHDKHMRVLVVRSGGKAIGIVPLVVQRAKHRLGGERVLTYPLEDWGLWYGPIGSNITATWHIAAKHIAESPRDWDTIRLPWLDTQGGADRRTAGALNMAGIRTRTSVFQESSLIEFAGGWDDYLAGLEKKPRQEARRHLRRFADNADICYLRHRPLPGRHGDGEPNWNLYRECEQVAEASWQAGMTEGNTLCHDDYRDFYRDAHEHASRLGMVDVNVLRYQDRAVAFNYCYHYDGCVFGLRMGFDRESAPTGAGRALVIMMLRDSCQRGDTRIEMGIGGQRYKDHLATSVDHNSVVTHIAPAAWRSHIIDWSQWFGGRVRKLAVG